MQQLSLFEPDRVPSPGESPVGLQYVADFISETEANKLLATIETLEFRQAKYLEYTARRRTVNYGAGYDFSKQRATSAPPLPDFLVPLIVKAAAWAKVDPAEFVQALISEYEIGTPLGWHRDVPNYEIVVGISLLGPGRLRFRPYPWHTGLKKKVFAMEVAPRSAYMLRGAARWQWQHSVPPAKVLRYSITLRTQRTSAG